MNDIKPCMNKECEFYDDKFNTNCGVIHDPALHKCKHYQPEQQPQHEEKEQEKSCETCGGLGVINTTADPDSGEPCPECQSKPQPEEPRQDWGRKTWAYFLTSHFSPSEAVYSHLADGIQQLFEKTKLLSNWLRSTKEWLDYMIEEHDDFEARIQELERKIK